MNCAHLAQKSTAAPWDQVQRTCNTYLPLVEVLQFYSWAYPGLLWSPGFSNHNPVYLPSSLVLQDLGWMSSGSDTYLNQGIIAHHFSVRATVELACYLTALSCFRSSWSGAGFCAKSGILSLGQGCMFLNIPCSLDLRFAQCNSSKGTK